MEEKTKNNIPSEQFQKLIEKWTKLMQNDIPNVYI